MKCGGSKLRSNSQFRPGAKVLVSYLMSGALLLLLVGYLSGTARADEIDTDPPAGVSPTILPTPEIMDPSMGEAAALHQLAQERGWDPTVWRDYSGRLYVENVITETDWVRALIRPFEFETGAQAAFLAEQEDSLLAGYVVTPASLRGFPAFWATLEDDRGQILERRLHWLAERWIVGVDAAGLTFTNSSIEEVARQLVLIGAQHGLPEPPTGTPSPSATPARGTPTRAVTYSPPEESPTAAPPTKTRSASATPTPCPGFEDVSADYWAYHYIRQIACSGIVTGYGDGTFRPQNNITRGQLVKMIVLAEDFAIISPLIPSFTDVPRSHTYYRFIETANSRRVVSGYSDHTFQPYKPVSRAQIAKIIVRAKRWSIVRPVTAPACDVSRTHWAADYIHTAMLRGVFTGYSDGCFHPDAPATRAQLAKVLASSSP
jgi:hypothetical protein